MVAIFTGGGSGLQNGSSGILGSAGQIGTAAQGRSGEQLFVNAANGSAVITQRDEFLVGRGPDVAIDRTYNSLGDMSDDNGDNWRQSTERYVHALTGTLNGSGSSIRRVAADGSSATYAWDGGLYTTTDGSGARDTLANVGGDWIWTDGDTRITERYAATGNGRWRIVEQVDADGNSLSFTYTGAQLTRVTTADGGWVQYGWNGANLVEIVTGFENEDQGPVTLTRVRYVYDSSNRLASAVVDLSPEDGSIEDGNAYTSSYTYYADSRHIASVTQTDGSRVNLEYDLQGRVTRVIQRVAEGHSRTTSLAYGAGFTTVTDPAGQVTRLEYAANGSLSRIVAPPARPGQADAVTSFSYGSSGDVTRTVDPLGRPTWYTYDARGNVLVVNPSHGRTVTRTYGARNELLTERQIGSSSSSFFDTLVTRYVYDGERHLRYRIDPEGGITEYRYNSQGQLVDTIEYPEHRFDTSTLPEDAAPSEVQLDGWRDFLADRSSVRIASNRYDARGNLAGTIRYAGATTTGDPVESAGDIRNSYAYDLAGRLLARSVAGEPGEAFAYDGLGRVVASTGGDGRKLSIAFLDPQLQTVITHSSGRVQVMAYDAAGGLVHESETDLEGGPPFSASSYRYDPLGRLRTSVDSHGNEQHQLFDTAGRKIADISALGEMTEYRLDSAGRRIASTRYAGRVSQAGLAALADPFAAVDPAQLRPAASADDLWEWQIYGDLGVAQSIDGSGLVTFYRHDEAGRVIETTRCSPVLSQATLDSMKASPPTSQLSLSWNPYYTPVVRTFYDRVGRQIATLDGEGYLTTTRYDAVGQKVEEVAFATVVPASARVLTWLGAISASIQATADDRHTRYAYDGLGQLRYVIDAGDKVVGHQYDRAGRNTATIEYGAIAWMPSGFDEIEAALQQLGAASWSGIREHRSVYDASGRLAFSIDPEDAVTGYRYDEMGRVIRTIAYAARFTTTGLPHPGVIGEWAEEQSGHSENRVTRHYYNMRDELVCTVDAEGYVTGNGYDALGRLTSVLRWPQRFEVSDETSLETLQGELTFDWTETRYGYDALGRVVDSWDGEGVRRHVDYNPDGTVLMETAAAGTAAEVRTRYDYDGAGRLIARFDADGAAEQAVTRFTRDPFGNVVAVTDPNGGVTQRSYDKRNRLLSETDAVGGVTRYEYDAFGDAVQITDPLGSVTRKSYDRLGRLARIVDAEDYVTENRYSMLGDLFEVVRRYAKGGQPHAQDAITQMGHDRLGRLVQVTDAEGGLQMFGRDTFGQEISYYNGVGWVRFKGYDRLGRQGWETRMVESRDSNGDQVAASVVTRFVYDSRGNRIRMTEAEYLPEQRTTHYVYDKTNRLIETRTDAVQVVSQSDHMTRTWATPTRRFRYDARGNLAETIEANGGRLLSYYDRRDRKIAEIDALGTYSAWTHDANGNVLTASVFPDPLLPPATPPTAVPPAAPGGALRRTRYGYDALNRLTTTRIEGVRTGSWNGTSYVAAVGDVVTTQVYDAAGNVVRTIDGNGATSWSYFDRLGRKVAEVDREKYLTTWIRDAEGNVLSERRFATPLGAAPGATPPSVPAAAADRETLFGYDRNGRRLTETRTGVAAWVIGATGGKVAASPDSTIRYFYNALGKVVRKVEANGDGIDYAYDMVGRLVQETRTAFTAWDGAAATPTVRYFYNAHGDLTLTRQGNIIQAAADRLTRYGYGPSGRLASMTDAASGTTYYSYDTAGNRVIQAYVRQKSDATQVSEGILYTRDLLGRVISQTTATWTGLTWLRSDSQDTAYDAFGQAVKTGVNGLWQMEFAYDSAGRLWRSNEGDGVWRFFVRDGAGNQTLAIESEGADLAGKSIDQVLAIATSNGAHAIGGAPVDGLNATISVYDGRGQLVQTRLPKRELILGVASVDLTAARSYNAFGELAGEIDLRGGRTDYTYNTMGRMVSIQRPTVSVTLENGTVQSSTRPTEYYFFDIAGRLTGVQDANSTVNTRLLLAGSGHGGKEALVVAEFHPDDGVMHQSYDRYGDLRRTTDEIGRATTMTYDGMGRLVSSARVSQTDYYSYDMLGRRLKHWTLQLGAAVFDSTDYDVQGRVVRAAAMGGDVTTTSFFWSPTLATPGMKLFGGWVSTTTYANGRTLIEYTDFFGREIYRKDLGGHEYVYRYDHAGRVAERTALAEDTLAYSHFNTGRVAQIATVAGPQRAGAYHDRVTTYGYDAAGNLKLERFVENDRPTLQMMSPGVRTRHDYRNMTANYDALGRLTQVVEQGGGTDTLAVPPARMDYEYDAVGNVRRVRSEHRALNALGVWASTATVTDLWYRYDSLNRLVTSQGQLSGGQIVWSNMGGIEIGYDAAGQRVQTKRFVAGAEHRETYLYDPMGNLSEVKIGVSGATPQKRASYEYNGPLGRLSRQIDYAATGGPVYDRTVSYNAKGQMAGETVTGLQGAETYQTTNVYEFGTGAAYALGAVVAIATSGSKGGSALPASRTENDFVWYGGAVQSVTRYWGSTSQTTPPFTSTYVTTAWGQLSSVIIADGRPRTVAFVNDMAGQVIRRDEGNGNSSQAFPHEFWYHFGGRQHGYVGNNGTFETSYHESIANRSAASGTGPFRLGATAPTPRSDFDQNYDPITSYQQGSSGGSYTVQSGDTLSSIAAALWGDASLWYKLAEANGMTASVALIEGQQLVVPSGIQRSSNNASTFNPYDPLEALGDTSPTTPQPQAPRKKKKCGGVFGAILLVVIAVVVTIVTSGAFLAAAGAASSVGSGISATLGLTTLAGASSGTLIAAGAVGGAVGSMVSQGIGVATGLQDRFSWKGVALAGLSGGIGAGVGAKMPAAGELFGATARGAAIGLSSNLLTQSVAVATGVQDKFDWAGVAAAAVGGAASAKAGANVTGSDRFVGAVSSSAGAIAGAATRSLVEGTDFGDNLLAALPEVVGSTIGSALAGRLIEADQTNRGAAESSAVGTYATDTETSNIIMILEPLSFAYEQLADTDVRFNFENLPDWVRSSPDVDRYLIITDPATGAPLRNDEGGVYVLPKETDARYLNEAFNRVKNAIYGYDNYRFFRMYTDSSHPNFLDFKTWGTSAGPKGVKPYAQITYFSESLGRMVTKGPFEDSGNLIYGFAGRYGKMSESKLLAAAALIQHGGPVETKLRTTDYGRIPQITRFGDAFEDRADVNYGFRLHDQFRRTNQHVLGLVPALR